MPRSTAALGLALLQIGCGAGWRSTDITPGPQRPRQQAQVWIGGRALRWHALVVSTDTISGVPFNQPPACDSCRVAVNRAEVDSVRFGDPTAGFWKSVALGFGISLVGVVLVCKYGSSCQLSD